MLRAGGVIVAAVGLAGLAGPVAATSGTARDDDQVVVAVSSDVPSAISPDGTRRYEIPWLRPGDRDVAIAPDGTRAAFSSTRDGNPEIYVAQLTTGEVTRITVSPGAEDRRPAWTFDGARLAWDSGAGADRDIVMGTPQAGTAVTALAWGPGADIEPTWSPDGTTVAFSSDRGGTRDLWIVGLAGGEPRREPAPPGAVRGPAWSPDGLQIAVSVARGAGAAIWVIDLRTGRARRLTSGRATDSAPDWSPGGDALTFAHSAGLDRSLRIVPAGGGSEELLPGTVGYTDPDWSTAGAFLTPTPELLPDLDQRAPADVQVLRLQGRWRVGFRSATENIGDGPLWLRGLVETPDQLRTDQVIALRGGGTRVARRVGRMRYEPHPPHFHWHFQPFVRYELRSADGGRVLVRDRKSGFCLIDRWGRALTRVPDVRPPRFTGDCGLLQRVVKRIEQGTSRGYSDIYPAFYHGQDIDLTGIPDGRYLLVHRVNPERRLRELRYGNNAASVLMSLNRPGGRHGKPVIRILKRCEHSEHCQIR